MSVLVPTRSDRTVAVVWTGDQSVKEKPSKTKDKKAGEGGTRVIPLQDAKDATGATVFHVRALNNRELEFFSHYLAKDGRPFATDAAIASVQKVVDGGTVIEEEAQLVELITQRMPFDCLASLAQFIIELTTGGKINEAGDL
jgi:hypothetical protein